MQRVSSHLPPSSRGALRSWGAGASLLSLVTLVVSAGNYGFSFLVVHLLTPKQFSGFSAAQGLLLVIGSGCMAAIPWAIARFIALHDTSETRQEALHFGLAAAAIQGAVAAPIAGIILGVTASLGVGIATGVATFAISMVAAPVGFLQGIHKLPALGGLWLLELVIRIGSATAAILIVSRTATAALLGFSVGSAALVVAGLLVGRSGFPLRRGARTTVVSLAKQSLNLGAIQVSLTMLGALDTVAALAAGLRTTVTASYQAAALLGRIPLFLSTAISLAAYTHMAAPDDERDVRREMTKALALYVTVTVPCVLACWTIPSELLGLLIPRSYAYTGRLLRFTSVNGAAVGWINIVSTGHQARGRFGRAIKIMGVAAIAQPILLIVFGRWFGIWVFASVLVAVSVGAATVLTLDGRRWVSLRPAPWQAIVTAGGFAACLLARNDPALWIASFGIVVVLVLLMLNRILHTWAGSPR